MHHDDHHDCLGEHHDHEHHTEDGHCGCGHDHAHHHHQEPREIPPVEGLTVLQQNMMLELYGRRFLPVASFGITRRDDSEVFAVALAPVYLGTPADTMEQVKALGGELKALEDWDLITLDYDLPLSGYPYTEYKVSDLYGYFQETVAEAAGVPGHVFDTPVLELGSMALTDAGRQMVQKMLN